MQMRTKIRLIASAAVLLASTAAVSAQAGVLVDVTVINNLPVNANYGFQNIAGTVSPPPANPLLAGEPTEFLVNSISTTGASGNFRYTAVSGGKACRFNFAAVSTPRFPPLPPTWNWTHSGTSVGTTTATCSSRITTADPSTGNFSVEFKIQ